MRLRFKSNEVEYVPIVGIGSRKYKSWLKTKKKKKKEKIDNANIRKFNITEDQSTLRIFRAFHVLWHIVKPYKYEFESPVIKMSSKIHQRIIFTSDSES